MLLLHPGTQQGGKRITPLDERQARDGKQRDHSGFGGSFDVAEGVDRAPEVLADRLELQAWEARFKGSVAHPVRDAEYHAGAVAIELRQPRGNRIRGHVRPVYLLAGARHPDVELLGRSQDTGNLPAHGEDILLAPVLLVDEDP